MTAAAPLLYKPLPRQLEAHRCQAPNVLFGGAAGGSKSHWLRWHLAKKCMKHAGLRTLLLRRHFTELEQTHLLAIRTEFPPEMATYDASRHRLTFPNGSILQFGHCNTDADFVSYLSTEWAIIGVDEGTQFTPYQLTMLPSRLRTTIPGFICQFCIASNPGGPGHLYLKSHFLEHSVDPVEHPGYKPEEWVYVPSRVQDNPYLTEGYVDRLKQLPEHARRAYLEGDWDVFSGQAFSEWRTSHHVQRYDPPPGWRWFAGVDWGYTAPCAVTFLAAGPERDILARAELYIKKKTPYEVGFLTGQMAKRFPALEFVAGDSAMWATSDGGPSVAEEFQRGLTAATEPTTIPLISAPKGAGSRAARKQLMHEHLRFEALPDGTIPKWSGAKLRIHPDCVHLIRTLPALPIDPHNSEDVDTEAEDHSYDSLTYALMARVPRPDTEDFGRVPDDVHPGIDRKRRRRKPRWETEPDDESVRMDQLGAGHFTTGIRYGGQARPVDEDGHE